MGVHIVFLQVWWLLPNDLVIVLCLDWGCTHPSLVKIGCCCYAYLYHYFLLFQSHALFKFAWFDAWGYKYLALLWFNPICLSVLFFSSLFCIKRFAHRDKCIISYTFGQILDSLLITEFHIHPHFLVCYTHWLW